MTKKPLETARDYAKWERKNEERMERLLEDGLPFESDDPKERENWDTARKEGRVAAAAARAEVLNANAKELTEAGIENAVSTDTFTLTKELPLVNMIGRGWQINPQWITWGPAWAAYRHIPKLVHRDTPPELIVAGLGEYAGQRKARVAPVEMTAFDLSNRIVERLGITGDDRMILPDTAARVLFILKDLKRGDVTIAFNRENAVRRGDWPPPRNWLVHRWRKEPKGELG